MLASGSLNTMIERVAYRPLRNAPKLAPLITAVGFSFILQNVGLLWIGGSPEGIPDLIDAQKELFNIGGVSVSQGDVLAVAATIPLVLLLTTFISQSRLGRAMRATAQDPEAARLMGINVDTTISPDFPARRHHGRRRRTDLRALPDHDLVLPGLPGRPDRLHRGGDGRHRQPPGRRARRLHHRDHPADLGQPDRRRVDAGDRVRLPGADHGLPTRRACSARRRGRQDELGRRGHSRDPRGEPHADRACGRPAGHAVASARDRDEPVHGVRRSGC